MGFATVIRPLFYVRRVKKNYVLDQKKKLSKLSNILNANGRIKSKKTMKK